MMPLIWSGLYGFLLATIRALGCIAAVGRILDPALLRDRRLGVRCLVPFHRSHSLVSEDSIVPMPAEHSLGHERFDRDSELIETIERIAQCALAWGYTPRYHSVRPAAASRMTSGAVERCSANVVMKRRSMRRASRTKSVPIRNARSRSKKRKKRG